MKKLLILLSVLFFISCGGGSSSTPAPALGTTPIITNVLFYNATDLTTPATSFTIGDYVYFDVYATDPDLDMTTLYVTEYYPYDSTTIYTGPVPFSLSSQPASNTIYTNLTAIEVTGPAGSYREEFQIQDAKANDSNIFIVYLSVS